MSTVAVEVNLADDLIPIIAPRRQDIPQRLKEMITIELFREGKVSSGKAAQILGISRQEFIHLLSLHNVDYFSQGKDEMREEFANA